MLVFRVGISYANFQSQIMAFLNELSDRLAFLSWKMIL